MESNDMWMLFNFLALSFSMVFSALTFLIVLGMRKKIYLDLKDIDRRIGFIRIKLRTIRSMVSYLYKVVGSGIN